MKRMVFLVSAILIFSCTTTKSQSQETRANEVISISTNDSRMNAIIEEARNTIGVFLERMNNPRPGDTVFQVKYPFETDVGSQNSFEHMWIGDIYLENGVCWGILLNEPENVSELEYGVKVSFSIDQISDWMIISNGRIIGGKSIKYLIEQIRPSERTQEHNAILQMFE